MQYESAAAPGSAAAAAAVGVAAAGFVVPLCESFRYEPHGESRSYKKADWWPWDRSIPASLLCHQFQTDSLLHAAAVAAATAEAAAAAAASAAAGYTHTWEAMECRGNRSPTPAPSSVLAAATPATRETPVAATTTPTPEAAAEAGSPRSIRDAGGDWVRQVLTGGRHVSPRVAVCLCQQVRLLQFIFKEHPKEVAFSLWGQEIQLLWLQGFITKVDDEASLLTLDDGTQTLEVSFDFGHPLQQQQPQQKQGTCRCAAACICGNSTFCCSKHAALIEAAETGMFCALLIRPHPIILQHEAFAEFRLERLSLAPSDNPNGEAEWIHHVRLVYVDRESRKQNGLVMRDWQAYGERNK